MIDQIPENLQTDGTGTIDGAATEWPVSNDEYHADRTCESSTTLAAFRDSRWDYYETYVIQSRERKPSSDAQNLGSAVHVGLLQPDEWDAKVACLPLLNLRTNDGKAEKAAFEAANHGKIILPQDDFDTARRMVDAAMANPPISDLLGADGWVEHAVRWRDQSGIALKVRFDKLLAAGDVIDLKTCRDPSPEAFGRAAWDYGYHNQAALYMVGADRYLGTNPVAAHLIIAVGNQEPYESFVYQLDEDAMAIGYATLGKTLNDLAACREAYDGGKNPDAWRTPGWGKINPLSLPAWAVKRFEESGV